jgi:hypothetical protein
MVYYSKYYITGLSLAILLSGLSSCTPAGLGDCPALQTKAVAKEVWDVEKFDDDNVRALRSVAKTNNLHFYYRFYDYFAPAKISDMDKLYKFNDVLICDKDLRISISNSVSSKQYIFIVNASSPEFEARARSVFYAARDATTR